jgi:hypothetical protein
MTTRRLASSAVALLCVLGAALTGSAATVSAAITHKYLSQITEVPAETGVKIPGPLDQVEAIAVDEGKLYAAEQFHEEAHRLDEFDAGTGAFLAQLWAEPNHTPSSAAIGRSGLAAGHSTGEEQIYAGSTEGVRGVQVFGSEGHVLNVWNGSDITPVPAIPFYPTSVAVDNRSPLMSLGWSAGDVYVADDANDVIDVFRPSAGGGEKYVTQLNGPKTGVPFAGVGDIAVDQNGDLIVIEGGQTVDVFEPGAPNEYLLVRQITSTPAGPLGQVSKLAVDGGNGEIYIAHGFEASGDSIDQFSDTGQYQGHLMGTATGAFEDILGLAVDPVSHDVYVGSRSKIGEPSAIDVFGPNLIIPDVTTAPATEIEADGNGHISATLNGTVNPDEEGEAACQFAWSQGAGLEQSLAPCEPTTVASGSAAVVVRAKLHLAPDTTYRFRLQASNKNGTNLGESWQDKEFTTPGPGLHGQSVSDVRAESTTFDAKIAPHGTWTSYYFQYGSNSEYGTDLPALSEGAPSGTDIGSGEADVEVSQHVQGLSAGKIYHYRVVVVSELAPGKFEYFYGSDGTFTTQTVGAPSQLPDGRAWEMVSPPHKEGAILGNIQTGLVGSAPIEASSSGDAFTDWSAFQPIEGDAPGAYDFTLQNFFGRGADGWTAKTIAPPHTHSTGPLLGVGSEYRWFSEDLSEAVVKPLGQLLPLAPGVSEATPYVRTDYLNGDPGQPCLSNCFEPLVTAENVPVGTKFGEEPNGECESNHCGPSVLSATPDLSHITVGTNIALTETSLEGQSGIYEWAAGKLQLANLLPENESNQHGGPVAPNAVGGGMSNDGSRVFWNATPGGPGSETHMYMRDMVKKETIRLDVYQGVAAPAKGQPRNEGSRLTFVSGQRLTVDSTATRIQPDLYEYDLEAPAGSRLTDLTVAAPGEHANVIGMLGSSRDGSYVYFAATGILAPGAVSGQCPQTFQSELQQGLCNLYVRHAGHTILIARLSKEDNAAWDRNIARVSHDGHWLAFMSNRNLTGYDTTDVTGRKADEEVYLYNASANRLVCASCNPSGGRPTGLMADGTQLVETVPYQGDMVASNLPPWAQNEQSRYLSNNGRLFFDSNDALVPQDVNGTEDVYEYEPTGVGDCTAAVPTFSERAQGCVALISSGTSNQESAFLDASEEGGDVFFLTTAKLLPRDFDNQTDIYDARECTVEKTCFASQPVPPPPCDTGESCKPAESSQPALFGSPSSATFAGVGNVASKSAVASVKRRPSARSQKLSRALRVCARRKNRKRRIACQRAARRRYGQAGAAGGNGTSTRSARSSGTLSVKGR